MVNEISYYLLAMISGRPMNLGALFLSLFYEGMKMWVDYLEAQDNIAIPGTIWFLFLNEYFPEFSRECSLTTELVWGVSTYSLHYKIVLIPTFSAFQLADRLFKMPPRLYLEICPFLYCSYGPGWIHIDLVTALNEEIAEMIPYWSSALTGRDLANGVRLNARSNKLSVEPYNPNCFAQQFSLIQGILAPYKSVVDFDDRPSLLPLEMKQLVTTNNKQI